MPSHFFDAIIVGSDAAGLVAGALLARRGYRVLQVDHLEPPGSYVYSGYPLPCEPSLLPPVEQSPVITGVFRELALAGQTYHGIGLAVSRFQALVPGHRIDLWHDRGMLAHELHREFPRKKTAANEGLPDLDRIAGQVAEFLGQFPALPPLGFWEARRVSREAGRFSEVLRGHGVPKQIREDNVLSRVLCAPVGHTTLSEGMLAHPAGARAVQSAAAEGWQLCPSPGRLKAVLRKRLRDLGGILLPGPRPAHIHGNGAKLAGVTLLESSHTYNCASLICATALGEVLPLLPEGRRRRKVEALAPAVEPRLCALTINLIAPSAAVPEGMGRAVFVSPDPHAEGESHVIFLGTLPVMRNKVAQKDETLVSATMVVARARLRRDRARTIAELKAELLERLVRPFPFIVEKAAIISTAYDAERMTDPSGENYSPDDYEPLDLCRAGGRLLHGLCALPAAAGWENLFFCSRQSFPGLGLEGEFFAGRTIADHITRLNPKKA